MPSQGNNTIVIIAAILLVAALVLVALHFLPKPAPVPVSECTFEQDRCMGAAPNYCYQGKVVKNCIMCGCTRGEACNSDGTCSKLQLLQELPEVKDMNLRRVIVKQDIPDLEGLEKKLGVLNPVLPPKTESPYQVYVTPFDPAVMEIAKNISGSKAAYSEALTWLWVSEETLNAESEKWLMPHEFLTETPTYPTNPVPGRVASDCEEHANTLVSLLRAEGISADHVRVALGKVNFQGSIGGHAWVEIYDNGQWIALEPSSGDYWDDETGTLHKSNGLPYDYFRTHFYPFREIWFYYNDTYFYDLKKSKGNAPSWWTPDIPRLVSSSGMPPVQAVTEQPAVQGNEMPPVRAA